jgi:DHA2 family multidrug resistance protein
MVSQNLPPRAGHAPPLVAVVRNQAVAVQNELPATASLPTPARLTAGTATAPHDLSSSARRQATIALMIVTTMQALDATIANVALPQLERAMRGGIDLGAWVMTSYLCAAAVATVLTGWLRRRYGARGLLFGAVALFVFASLLCAAATSPAALVGFRLVQGAAAAVVQPLAQAVLLDIHPKPAHGRILAIWGATIMAGPMLGPVLGGLITDWTSWRWIFALNAPLGAIAILGLVRLPSGASPVARPEFDGVGVLLLVLGIGMLQLAVERSIGSLWPPRLETVAEGGRHARLGLHRGSQPACALHAVSRGGVLQPQLYTVLRV